MSFRVYQLVLLAFAVLAAGPARAECIVSGANPASLFEGGAGAEADAGRPGAESVPSNADDQTERSKERLGQLFSLGSGFLGTGGGLSSTGTSASSGSSSPIPGLLYSPVVCQPELTGFLHPEDPRLDFAPRLSGLFRPPRA